MKISAIELSRVLGFVELNDLNPMGAVSFTRIVPRIVETVGFTNFPKTLEDFDEKKGIVFEDGIWNNIPIQKMTVYGSGITLDTRAGTNVSQTIIDELIFWASHEFGLVAPPNGIQRFRYLSQLTFFSDVIGYLGGPPAKNLATSLSEKVGKITLKSREYKVKRLDIDFDRTEQEVPIAPLTIQRRVTTPFEENKFFTEAPLPTQEHIGLLEQFESDLINHAVSR